MKKICIATGGTGGHIYPALALAQIWKEQEPDTKIVFLGNDDRMEAQIIPAAGYSFIPVHASGLTGGLKGKVRALKNMFESRRIAIAAFRQEKPDLVIGFGGYVTAPAALAAKALHIPYMLHEQNSIVGKANQFVAAQAAGIVTCYEKAQQALEGKNARLLGNPRASVAVKAEGDEGYYRSLGLDPARPAIMIVMGSLGSSSINALMQKALAKVDPTLQILYVCGKDNDSNLHLFDHFPNVHMIPFVDALRVYPFLKGLVCRAGATTLSELTALGLPAVLIPSPYVAENHQFYNADMLVQKGAAIMVEEKDLNADTLARAIDEAFVNEDNRRSLHEKALSLGTPQAAQEMIRWANTILEQKANQK